MKHKAEKTDNGWSPFRLVWIRLNKSFANFYVARCSIQTSETVDQQR